MFKLGLILLTTLFTFSIYGNTHKDVHIAPNCKKSFSSSASVRLQREVSKIMAFAPTYFKHYWTKKFFIKSPQKVLDLITEVRVRQIASLARLERANNISQPQRKLVQLTRKKLQTDMETNLKLFAKKAAANKSFRTWGELKDSQKSNPLERSWFENYRSFALAARGTLMESIVALQVRDLNALELHIDKLILDQWPKVFEGQEGHTAFEAAKDLEMDVVANQYREWVEVKSFDSKNPKRARKLKKAMMLKTKRIKLLSDRLYEAYGLEIQFHIVVRGEARLNREFKIDLEAEGAIVHLGNIDNNKFLK